MRQLAKVTCIAFLGVLALSPCATAAVFINEVFINPSEGDDFHEFIELLGTPGMKLDGYAIAVLNGAEEKYYTLDSIPPIPIPAPEIDEFFSLDGLSLGSNGILALLTDDPTHQFRYPELLSDSAWVNWEIPPIWNGGLDEPGKLTNDGSITILLIRNRPGATEADPCNPNGLRWGKEIRHDAELFTPVQEPNGAWVDQYGDGNLDRADSNGMGGNTIDLVGASTLGDITDDLEVVDEVSFEDGSGWEYDTDGRHVDEGGSYPLPHRHVHALDDPVNFNPDAISRVDYRTKGPGWLPSEGGIGEMANGNNWQDTATEQWIRGSCLNTTTLPRHFFYDNDPNEEPNTVQPYETHVPLWLSDGNVPDYNFSEAYTYEISAGRINSLSVPFIPGDVDRDGVCDINDITKLASVFGDYDWIFANSCSYPDAIEGDSNDPATQTKPWDVDGTGDNGIEPSDMQWVLNFQGDTTGQIVGIQYDSTTPASSGVVLNSNAGTECTLTTSVNIPSGRTLSALIVGDIVEITIEGQVTAGPNTVSGHENGIMQYIHDLEVNNPGIVKVTSVEALGSFSKTRASLETLQGTGGDLGVELINGFTTSFTQGLSEPDELYRVTLHAVGTGSASVSIVPAADSMFAASTPRGLKIGHTDTNGDPDYSVYPTPLSITAVTPSADFDGDNDVDGDDYVILAKCWLTQLGDPNYNPLCDISSPADTKINLLDLDKFVDQWLAGT